MNFFFSLDSFLILKETSGVVRSCILKFGLENTLIFLTTWIIWSSYGFKANVFLRFIYVIPWITGSVPQVYRTGSSRFRRILILFQGQLHEGENQTNRMENASKIQGQLFQELYQNDWQQSCQTWAKTAPVSQPTGFYLLSLCYEIPSGIKNFVTSRDSSSW